MGFLKRRSGGLFGRASTGKAETWDGHVGMDGSSEVHLAVLAVTSIEQRVLSIGINRRLRESIYPACMSDNEYDDSDANISTALDETSSSPSPHKRPTCWYHRPRTRDSGLSPPVIHQRPISCTNSGSSARVLIKCGPS